MGRYLQHHQSLNSERIFKKNAIYCKNNDELNCWKNVVPRVTKIRLLPNITKIWCKFRQAWRRWSGCDAWEIFLTMNFLKIRNFLFKAPCISNIFSVKLNDAKKITLVIFKNILCRNLLMTKNSVFWTYGVKFQASTFQRKAYHYFSLKFDWINCHCNTKFGVASNAFPKLYSNYRSIKGTHFSYHMVSYC